MKTRGSSKLKRPVREKPPTDPLELLGVLRLAAVQRLTIASTLAFLATILTGVSGPVCWFATLAGICRLPKLNLMVLARQARVMHQIDPVVQPLLAVSRRLAANASDCSAPVIEYLSKGTFADNLPKSLKSGTYLENVLSRHRNQLKVKFDRQLSDDLAFRPDVHRVEALVHTEFILVRPRPKDMVALTNDCHVGTSLIVVPDLGLDRAGSEPHTAARQLTELLAGMPGLQPASMRTHHQLNAQAILTADPSDLVFLVNHRPALLEQLLILPDIDERPVDAPQTGVQTFNRLYLAAVNHLLEVRRQGREPLLRLDDRAQSEFARRQAGFDQTVNASPIDCGSSARALPSAILWALGFLARALPLADQPTDSQLVTTAFNAAGKLLDNHLRQLREVNDAIQIEERLLTVERVNQAFETRDRMTTREISRLFANQRKSFIEPVLQVMVKVGLLVNDGGVYQPGGAQPTDEAIIAAFQAEADRECGRLKPGKRATGKTRKTGKPAIDKLDSSTPSIAQTAGTTAA